MCKVALFTGYYFDMELIIGIGIFSITDPKSGSDLESPKVRISVISLIDN